MPTRLDSSPGRGHDPPPGSRVPAPASPALDAGIRLDPDEEESLAVGQGDELHLEHFLPPGAPVGLLVTVHGFSAHAGLYRHVGRALARRGLAVTQFDCRGHGRSTGRRGHVRRFSDYLDDLEAVIARARSPRPGWPSPPPPPPLALTLMGHSQGAAIAAAFVLEGRTAPGRMVLAAPWFALRMKVPAWKRLAAPLTSALWPTLSMGNGLRAADVSRNPDVVANFDRDPLVHHVATPRWFREVLAAQARIRAAAHALAVPTLLLVAGQDRIVSNEASLAFARDAAAMVDVRQYEPLYHELFLEPERETVIEDIATWLMRPDSPRAPANAPAPGTAAGILRSSA